MTPASDDGLRRIDALVGVGLRLARSAPSGRVLLAQLAARIDPVWVARPWGDDILDALGGAAEAAREPMRFRDVERALKDAWGGKPTDELDELDAEPVAVTPSAQVHRGTLDGVPVAVKVQRPGLARSVGQDLALLDGLAGPLSAAFPALDAGAVLREVAERTRDELDLEHAASVGRRLHRALRRGPAVGVPSPNTSLARPGVLVSDWVDGRALGAVDDPDEAGSAGAALVRGVLGAGTSHGVMPAGLTPEDVIVDDDGRVWIVDVGVSAPVDRERLAWTAGALDALLDDDAAAFSAAVSSLDWLGAEDAPAALGLLREVLGPLLGPGSIDLDAAAVRDAGLRLADRRADALALVRAGRIAPADVWPLRAAGELFMLLARVGWRGDAAGLARDALRDGLA